MRVADERRVVNVPLAEEQQVVAGWLALSGGHDLEVRFEVGQVGVGQVEIVDIEEARSRKQEILDEMKRMTAEEGYDMVFMMLTDIIQEGTELLVVGDEDGAVTRKAFNAELKDNSVYIEGMMSRKKQVIPPLEKTMS